MKISLTVGFITSTMLRDCCEWSREVVEDDFIDRDGRHFWYVDARAVHPDSNSCQSRSNLQIDGNQ